MRCFFLFIFFLFLRTGHTITVKRSSKILVNAAKLQAERDKKFADNQTKMLVILEDLQSKLTQLCSQSVMRKNVQIDSFFPVKVDGDLERFLDKSDGLFQSKREEFENFLFCNVTMIVKHKRPFESHLLSTLFARDYISSHKWPGPRYEQGFQHVFFAL